MASLHLEPIDSSSKIPYYLQMKNALLEHIKKQTLQPGDILPSEAQLGKQFNVSRTVVRQALMELEYEDLIYKRKGKGAFISEPKVKMGAAHLRTGFTQDIASQGSEVHTELLSSKVELGKPEVLRILHLQEGDEVFNIRRRKLVNNQALVIITSYLPFLACKALVDADLTQPLNKSLKTLCDIELSFENQNIEAVAASADQARLLGVKCGNPLLKLSTVSYRDDNTPLKYSVSYHRGDWALIQTSLMRIKNDQLPKKFGSEDQNHVFYTID